MSISGPGYVYQDVVELEGTGKAELYFNGKTWLLAAMSSNGNLIYLDERDNGLIIASGTVLLTKLRSGCSYYSPSVKYKITLQFKDQKYYYKFDNMILRYNVNCGEFGSFEVTTPLHKSDLKPKLSNKLVQEFDEKINLLIQDLKESMAHGNDLNW